MTGGAGSSVAGRRPWVVWTLLFLPPVTLGLLVVGYLASHGLTPADPVAERAVRRALPYLLAVNHLGLFTLLVVVLRRNGERLADIGWTARARGSRSSLPRELAVGAVCALGLYLFKELAVDSLRLLLAGHTPTFTSLFRFRPGELEVPLALAATLLVFVEESLYRGYALPWLEERRGTAWAVGITSAAFGLLHWGNGLEAIAATAVIGALLAGVFVWRRNLVAGTTAHALYNLAVLLT